MKLVIKVGGATIEVEAEKIEATKVIGGETLVEITKVKSKDEEFQEQLDRLSAGLREVLIRERQAGRV